MARIRREGLGAPARLSLRGYAAREGQAAAKPRYTFAAVWIGPRMIVTAPTSDRGEAIEREKSMIYRTVLGQNKQGVSWCRSSVTTLRGNERKHSVQVSTT
jgi:hypothetical protein